MLSSTTVFLMNMTIMVSSITVLCISASIFDFIVMNRMYYTVPDQNILLEPEQSYWFYGVAVFSLTLSILCYFYESTPKWFRERTIQYPEISSLMHSILLSISCIGSAYCAFISAQTSNDLSKFAYNSTPRQFQLASYWYFIRFRVCSLLFGLNCVLSLSVLCILYLGIQCRYRSFAQLPQTSKKEVIMRTTLFA
ncbi:unnamed protein product [Auanema sp. JU1783]|nr:unnamed protein product [Auanema sp. JU1783]